jgi:hypothetical protein
MTIRMEPACDLRSFRRALGHFPTGVCVVTSQVDNLLAGMTISSFNSLSLEPPLVLFSIDGKAASLFLLEKAEGYAITCSRRIKKTCRIVLPSPAPINGKGPPTLKACSARQCCRGSPRCSNVPRGRPMQGAITSSSSPR